MKKVCYFTGVFVLAAAAVTFAVLYFNVETPAQENFLHSHHGQWLMSGDRHLFDVTERAFEALGVFGFPEGTGRWAPVGGKQKSLFYPTVVAGSQAMGIAPDEYVIGVVSGGTATAYPLRVVSFHQIVNDDTQAPVVVVYFGNHSHTAAAFSGGPSKDATFLASTGCLYKNVDLLFDHATESLFLPLAGTFVAGQRLGERLPVLPSAVMPFAEWMKLYPQSRVMTLNTGLKSVKYPRKDILAKPPAYKVRLKSEAHPPCRSTEPVLATSDGWYTTYVPLSAAARAAMRDVTFVAQGRSYTAHFTADFKAGWITDSSGALAPSLRSTYRPYSAVMREAVIVNVR